MTQPPAKVMRSGIPWDGAGDTPTQRPHTRSRPQKRPWRRLFIASALLAILGIAALWLAYLHFDRTPGELMRYAERRLIGHNKLEAVILPVFALLRPHIERPVSGPLPTLGKGQQAKPLPPQQYSAEGRPLAAAKQAAAILELAAPNQVLASEAEIQQAIANARPGQVLEIAPGTYTLTNKVRAQTAGTPTQPIVVRARAPGSVTILFATTEGFHVTAPYWQFENLVIRGKCKQDSDCEHAFHIVGKARSTVIRNNRIEDFNAQIKVNGQNGDWPDDGLIQYNTLTNSRRRETHLPVTPIDIVGADRWQVADNLISNFIKGDGNKVSYGAFMKGGGSDGRFERNLVICTDKDISQAGLRVGLSFGGGGTGAAYCRDQRCITEHSRGVFADNTIAHCNDFGIYVNNSNQTTITHNTLTNTAGIDVRFPAATAELFGNTNDGRTRTRDGAEIRVLTAATQITR